MVTEVIVPIRGFDTAKNRLSAVLSPAERRTLSGSMLAHVVRVLSGSRGIRCVWVVGGADAERAIAFSHGGRWLREAGNDLNSTLNSVRETLLRNGARSVGVVLGDLPLLEQAEVEGLLDRMRSRGYDVCFAPDMRGEGTNAVFVRSDRTFMFQFGVGSLKLHLAQAARRGFRAMCWRSRGFGLDIDIPSDLAHLRDLKRGAHLLVG